MLSNVGNLIWVSGFARASVADLVGQGPGPLRLQVLRQKRKSRSLRKSLKRRGGRAGPAVQGSQPGQARAASQPVGRPGQSCQNASRYGYKVDRLALPGSGVGSAGFHQPPRMAFGQNVAARGFPSPCLYLLCRPPDIASAACPRPSPYIWLKRISRRRRAVRERLRRLESSMECRCSTVPALPFCQAVQG